MIIALPLAKCKCTVVEMGDDTKMTCPYNPTALHREFDKTSTHKDSNDLLQPRASPAAGKLQP